MTERVIILANPAVQSNAILIIRNLPVDGSVEIAIRPRRKVRSLDSNAKMWAMLNEISEQVNWHGNKLTAENWKDVFTASLKRQTVVPGLDGGFVVCGTSTRKMTVGEMNELIELMNAFGAEHQVKFKAADRGMV